MQLISWNVNGLRACLTQGFMDFFLAAGADFQGHICTDCGLVVFDYENPMDRWL